MEPINILDARNNLSRLVAAARSGEQVVIAKRGVPVARLVALDDAAPEHSASEAAMWLMTSPVPTRVRRSAEELDAEIAVERASWE